VLARTAKALDKGESDEQYAYDARGQLQRGAIRFVPATGEPVALDEEYKWQANGLPAQRGVRSYEWRRTGAGVLESVRLADKEWTFGAFGRMVASPHVSRFGWYGEGRIACAVAGPGRSTRYSYQPDGERFASVTKDGAASETLVYVNKYVVYSKEMDAYELHHFVGERRIAQRGFDGELVYLGLDRVASARVEVTTAGAVRAHHIYDPFGAELAAAEDAAARHRFAGALHDGGSGLYQMKARHYDPELGTFVSPDSYFITKPDKVLKRTLEGDLYSYAHNAPILLSDPTGEFAINFGSKGDVKAVGMVGIEHGVVFAVNTSSGVPFMDRFSFSKYTTVSCGVATNTGVTVLGLAAGFSYGPQNVEGFGGKGLAVELGAETPIFNAGVEGGVSVGPGQLQASMGVSLGVGGFLPAEAEISVQNTYVDNALPGSVPKQGFDLVVALCSPDIKTDPPNISGLKDPSGPVATTPTIGPAR
jgi:RHS repeat-associated protein